MLPNVLSDNEESIRPLFDPDSHPAISVLPSQLKEHYNQLVDDCEEKVEQIQDATKYVCKSLDRQYTLLLVPLNLFSELIIIC